MTTPTDHPADETSHIAARRLGRPGTLDRPSQLTAGFIVVGVVIQGGLAGGFLAGRPTLRHLHEHLGYGLTVAAAMLLVIGLAGRRRRPATTRLPTRMALLLALTVTVFAGMRASRGTVDLLMLHIPLAFVVLTLATRLLLLASKAPESGVTGRRPKRGEASDPRVRWASYLPPDVR